MPELPEVEIVRQSLNRNIKQKKVKNVIIRNRSLRKKVPLKFKKFLENKKIKRVSRFSKYLILHLPDDNFCLIHLGMSGTIHILKNKKKNYMTNSSFYSSPFLPKKHNHIEIIFDKFKVIYNDPRRFGFFETVKNKSELKEKFSHLGPEPFDKKFNIKYVKNYSKKKKINVKNLLIDQRFVSGIGNIYASEILFLSKINPNKKIKLLKKIEFERIINYSKLVLLNAIKKGGSSIRDFKNIDGHKGSFQDDFNVYQREGHRCKQSNCKGTIKKKMITNRSTFFCNFCQN